MCFNFDKKNGSLSTEETMWRALELDSLNSDMKSGDFAPNNQLSMGTGRTDNACYMCSNSCTTHGCGGC